MKASDRYSARAIYYSKYRWDYAADAVRTVFDQCGLTDDSVVADIGSGTGKLTSHFAGRVRTILRSPDGPGHASRVVASERAGDVAVHTARASGLAVTAVAAAPGVPAADVLAAAYDIAPATVTGGPLARRSLFDLPLGDSPLWTLTERRAATHAPDGREDVNAARCSTYCIHCCLGGCHSAHRLLARWLRHLSGLASGRRGSP